MNERYQNDVLRMVHGILRDFYIDIMLIGSYAAKYHFGALSLPSRPDRIDMVLVNTNPTSSTYKIAPRDILTKYAERFNIVVASSERPSFGQFTGIDMYAASHDVRMRAYQFEGDTESLNGVVSRSVEYGDGVRVMGALDTIAFYKNFDTEESRHVLAYVESLKPAAADDARSAFPGTRM